MFGKKYPMIENFIIDDGYSSWLVSFRILLLFLDELVSLRIESIVFSKNINYRFTI
jgi:hypothetical protein